MIERRKACFFWVLLAATFILHGSFPTRADEDPPEDLPVITGNVLDANDTDYEGPTKIDAEGLDLIWVPNLRGPGEGGYSYGTVIEHNSAPPVNEPNGTALPTTVGAGTDQSHVNSDPVLGSGEFVLTQTDLDFPGFGMPFQFTRVYRSKVRYFGSMGFGWSHNFQRRIIAKTPEGTEDCAGFVYYLSDRMERIRFTVVNTSIDGTHLTYTAGQEVPLQLDQYLNRSDSWELRDGSGLTYYFNGATGTLHRIQDPAGNTITIAWDHSIRNDEEGVVSSVRDTTGRLFHFHYKTVHPTEFGREVAILKCISLSANDSDCSSINPRPLLTFEMTPDAETYGVFDLARVLNANGVGPSYAYYRTNETAEYLADSDIDSVCHAFCDKRGTDADNCHNYDYCDKAINELTSHVCDFDNGSVVPFVCANGLDPDSCQLASQEHFATKANNDVGYVDAPFFSLAPFYYSPIWSTPILGQSILTGYVWHLDDGRHDPGFGFCLQQCLGPSSSDQCYSDVFPLCTGLEPVEELPDGSQELTTSERRIYRLACGCMYAQNLTYCNFHPAQPGCASLLNSASSPPHLDPVTGQIRGRGLPSNFLAKYATACRPITETRIEADNPTCSGMCYQQCVGQVGAKDVVGKRRYAFGRIQELDHDLVEAYDGEGRLVLNNTYGVDPFEASFDRVVSQQLTDTLPDNVLEFEYHELSLEQESLDDALPLLTSGNASTTPDASGIASRTFDNNSLDPTSAYSLHLDPAHVSPLTHFDSVEVCPDVCTSAIAKKVSSDDERLVPVELIDPQTHRLLSSPITLRRLSEKTIEVVGPKTAPSVGLKVFPDRMRTRRGDVSFRPGTTPSVAQVIGSAAALTELFGESGVMVLEPGIVGAAMGTSLSSSHARSIVAGTGMETRRSVSWVRGAEVARDSADRASGAPTRSKVSQLLIHDAKNIGDIKSTPAGTSGALFLSNLRARGYSVGSTALVFTRTDGNHVRLGRAMQAGEPVARVRVGNEWVTLFATDKVNVFRTDVIGDKMFDDTGYARLGAIGNGTLVAEPRGKLSAEANRVWEGLGQSGKSLPWLGFEPGPEPSCEGWTTFAAKVNTSIAHVQQPSHAVVVHDTRGVIRTRYYDDSWRLLREVNDNTLETTNYNYRSGMLHGVQYPAGDRKCQNGDGMGHVLEVQRLPAPNYPGAAEVQITRFAYSVFGRLTDIISDPTHSTSRMIHIERDAADRAVFIDTTVDATHTDRVTVAYDGAAGTNGVHTYPTSIMRPDGSLVTSLKYDPNGGGVREEVYDDSGSDPVRLYHTFDSFGRSIGSWRYNHPGSERRNKYDPAGLLTTSGVSDLTAPNTWIDDLVFNNGAGQPVRVSTPEVDQCLDMDVLNQVHVSWELPKDGITEPRATCYRYGIDGRLDYKINATGSVELYRYDDNGRLMSQEKGFPPDMTKWAEACLQDSPAPVSHIAIERTSPIKVQRTTADTLADIAAKESNVAARLATSTSANPSDRSLLPSKRMGRLLQAQVPSTDQRAARWERQLALPVGSINSRVPLVVSPCALTGPTWPGTKPANDHGMETRQIQTYGIGGFPRAVSDGQGVGHQFQTDGFGRIIVATDGNMNQVWRGFDTRDRVTWLALLGPTTRPYARPETLDETLPVVAMEEYSYDALDRLRERATWDFTDKGPVDPLKLKIVTSYVYDDTKHAVAISIDNGTPTVVEFDGQERERKMTLPEGTTINSQYLPDGNQGDLRIVKLFLQGQHMERVFHYDNVGHLARIEDGLHSPLLNRTFNRLQRVVSETNSNDASAFGYDAYGRLITVGRGEHPTTDGITTFGWDREDNLVSVSTDNAVSGPNVTKGIYDGLNRLMEIDGPEGRQMTSTYYAGTDRLRALSYAGGANVNYNYDSAGHVALQSVQTVPGAGLDGVSFQRQYTTNALGLLGTAQVVSSQLPTGGLTTSFSYDSRGNCIAESNDGFVPLDIRQAYDRLGLISARSIVSHSSGEGTTIHLSRDPLGRLQDVSLDARSVAHLVYRGLGDPTKITYGVATGHNSPIEAILNYDVRGRSTTIEVKQDSTVIAAAQEQYGVDDIPRVRVQSLGGKRVRTDVFEVNGTGMVVAEGLGIANDSNRSWPVDVNNGDVDALIESAAWWRRYSVDGLANWVGVQGTDGVAGNNIDELNGYTAFNHESVTYNNKRDVAGLGSEQYEHDGLGEMTSAVVNGRAMRFSYDALGRRILTEDVTTRQGMYFVWTGEDIAAYGSEISDGSDAMVNIPGRRVNDHLALGGALGAGPIVYLHQSQDQSVFAATDDGGMLEGYRYSSYGETSLFDAAGREITSSRGDVVSSSVGNLFMYQGQVYDAPIAEYFMRAREYRPAWGRFLSPDPVGELGGGNLYAFVDSAPLKYTDPYGLDPSPITWTQRLTSSTFQQQYQVAFNQTFGTDRGYLERTVGLANMIAGAPLAAAEQIGNLPGAFAGNIIDQTVLRNQGREREADAALSGAGEQIQNGLFSLASVLASVHAVTIGLAQVSASWSGEPIVGGGANLRRMSAGDIARIQNAANRTGQQITVIGSRARGTAGPTSDWDYIVEGANSSVRHSLASSLPEGIRLELGSPRNAEFVPGPVNQLLPYITFLPRR